MARSGALRHFCDQDKKELLRAIEECRKAVIRAETKAPPFKDVYKACLVLDGAIDELAFVLTGDRGYFHIKMAPSAKSPDKPVE
jgi:hypothetical protein